MGRIKLPLDLYASIEKLQNEKTSEMIQMRNKQAEELAAKRVKYNQQVEETRERQMRERKEKQDSFARKLAESRQSKRSNTNKESRKSRMKSLAKDAMNTNSNFRGPGRLLQAAGLGRSAQRFLAATNHNYSFTPSTQVSHDYDSSEIVNIAKEKINQECDKTMTRAGIYHLYLAKKELENKEDRSEVDNAMLDSLSKRIKNYLRDLTALQVANSWSYDSYISDNKTTVNRESVDNNYSHIESWNLLSKFCADK